VPLRHDRFDIHFLALAHKLQFDLFSGLIGSQDPRGVGAAGRLTTIDR
jgi:hypothetical protein